MAIVRWDPFGEMLRMQREADRIFSRMGTGQGGSQGQGQEPWMPRIDIKQSGEDMQIRAELPGMKPEDVDIDVTEGILTIRGERKQEEEREDEGWLVRESSYGSFMRQVALPESVDANSIRADYKDGVLEMTVPKAFQEVKPQTTKISIGGAQTSGAMGSGQQSQQGQQAMQGQQQGQQQAQGQTQARSSDEPTEGDRPKVEEHEKVGAQR